MRIREVAKERIKESALNVPMPRSLRELVRREAQRRLMSESAVVREALLAYFERMKG